MLDKVDERIKTLKNAVRKDQAWIRLFEEYNTGKDLTDLLMVNRQLTKHEKKLLMAVPELRWNSAIDHLQLRNILLIRKTIIHFLEQQLLSLHEIKSNSSLVDHISFGTNTAITLLNRWYKVESVNQLSISMIATIDVSKKYFLPGFKEKEIILPSRCSDIPVDSVLSYATVVVKVLGIADLSNKYIYYNGRIVSEHQGYNEFLESYQAKPWYRKIGAFAPTPFDKWIEEQTHSAKPPYVDPKLLLKSGVVTNAFLTAQADLFAQQVSSEFDTLWSNVLGHPHVNFRTPIIKLKR